MPVHGQLHQSLQVRLVLRRDQPPGGRYLGFRGVVASGNPQQERMPVRVTSQRRQPGGVAAGGQQVRVLPYA